MFLKKQVMESASIESLDSEGVKGNCIELSSQVFESKSRSSRPEVFCKKGVFKISLNSPENTYARNSF